ncbi:DUF4097 family beta strand repeat-containing protein [Pleomorphovibrio marinus]|uniref:hypothetical protein n=1 Tax=Pleomorphovibrio marinus TaxID=2164132 RepID=UPI000E0CBD06|nr:hypothetical protein [Pleomorphovibrio marinus]
MLKKIILLLFCGITTLSLEADAQITRQFTVEEKEGYGLVCFNFSSYKGISTLKREFIGHPISANASLGKINILPSFSHEIVDGVLFANLEHKNVESESLGRTLSYRLFSNSNPDFDHAWDIGLDGNYLYDLNLHFGIGQANLDFSHLPVSNCKIKTASADVYLEYGSKMPNTVNMDTLMVAIHMGSLYADNLQLSNAKTVLFDVSYGSVNLSFSDLMAGTSSISTVVGAGSVNIQLPEQDLPYLVKIKSTAMCRTKIPSYLKEIGDKTYVSRGYDADAKNLMTFLIDVSVGSVSLK